MIAIFSFVNWNHVNGSYINPIFSKHRNGTTQADDETQSIISITVYLLLDLFCTNKGSLVFMFKSPQSEETLLFPNITHKMFSRSFNQMYQSLDDGHFFFIDWKSFHFFRYDEEREIKSCQHVTCILIRKMTCRKWQKWP